MKECVCVFDCVCVCIYVCVCVCVCVCVLKIVNDSFVLYNFIEDLKFWILNKGRNLTFWKIGKLMA